MNELRNKSLLPLTVWIDKWIDTSVDCSNTCSLHVCYKKEAQSDDSTDDRHRLDQRWV